MRMGRIAGGRGQKRALVCVAAVAAMAAMGCAGADAAEGSDEAAEASALESGATVRETTRDTGSSASDGKGEGPEVTDVTRDGSPSTDGKGDGPQVTGVTRSDGTTGSTTRSPNGGLEITSVTRTEVTPKAPGATDVQLGGTFTGTVTANGSGCAAGTSTTNGSDGTFTTTLNAFSAQTSGPGGFALKNCQLGIALKSSENLSYAVTAVSIKGQASLAAGSSATTSANLYVQGDPSVAIKLEEKTSGFLSGALSFDKQVAPTAAVWTPCGVSRSLNVGTTVRLDQGTSPASAKVDASQIVVHVASRRCN